MELLVVGLCLCLLTQHSVPLKTELELRLTLCVPIAAPG